MPSGSCSTSVGRPDDERDHVDCERSAGGMRTSHPQLLRVVLDEIESLLAPRGHDLFVAGARHIFEQPEFSDSSEVAGLVDLLERKEVLADLLAGREGVVVTIGEENEPIEMRQCSVVTASYSAQDAVGVLGNNRADANALQTSPRSAELHGLPHRRLRRLTFRKWLRFPQKTPGNRAYDSTILPHQKAGQQQRHEQIHKRGDLAFRQRRQRTENPGGERSGRRGIAAAQRHLGPAGDRAGRSRR